MIRLEPEHKHFLLMIVHLPCWLVTKATYPLLPQTHPWKLRGAMFTLDEWAEGATKIVLHLSVQMWFWLACIVILALRIRYD